MNTKLSELLFEEKNIHKVFEKKILKEEDESQSNLVMNNQQLNVVGKRISAILDKAFPSEDVIFQRIEDGELSKDDTAINFTGIKTLEKKTLQGMLVNTFSVKGDTDEPATQFDINKYEKWGFIPFTIRTKSGEEVEGKNSAGQELTQLFLLPIPGFTTDDQSLIALHTELFKLQGKVDQGEVMLHAGVGDMLRHISIPTDQEEELQKALRSEKIQPLMQIARNNKSASMKSVKSEKPSNKPSDEEEKNVEDGVMEGKFYKEKLSNLLFEKKSLRKLSSNKKKELVEHYLDVKYSSLNNFQKRDALQVVEFITKLESNVLLELNEKQKKKVEANAKKAEDEGLDRNNWPTGIETTEEKKGFLSKIKKYAGKIKDPEIKNKLASFFKKKKPADDPEEVSKKEPEELDSEHSKTYAVNVDYLDKYDWEDLLDNVHDIKSFLARKKAEEESSEESSDEESSEESSDEESSEESSDEEAASEEEEEEIDSSKLFTSKALIEHIKAAFKEDAERILNPNNFKKQVDDTVNKISELIKNIPDFVNLELKNLKDQSQDIQIGVKMLLEDMSKGKDKFLAEARKMIEAIKSKTSELLKIASDGSLKKDIASFLNKQVKNINDLKDAGKRALIELYQSEAIQQAQIFIGQMSAELYAKTLTFFKLNDDNGQGNALVSIVQQEVGKSKNEPQSQELSAAARIVQALSQLGVTDSLAKELLGNKSKTSESFTINNFNLLHPDVSNEKLLIREAGVKDPSALKLADKIVRMPNGKINPSALKYYYKDFLPKNSAYNKIQDKFIKDLENRYGKKLDKSSSDEVSPIIEQYFNEIAGGSIKTQSMLGRAASSVWSGTKTVLGSIFGNLGKIAIGSGLLAIGYSTYLINSAGGANLGIGEAIANLLPSPETIVNAVGALKDWLTGIESMSDLFSEVAFKINEWLTGSLGSVWSYISSKLAAVGTVAWVWIKAPYVAYAAAAATSGGTLAGINAALATSPYLYYVLLNIGAAFTAAAGLLTGGLGLGLTWLGFTTAGATLASKGSLLITAATSMLKVAGGLTFGVPGVLTVALIAAIGAAAWQRRKAKKRKEFEEKIGEAFRLYLLQAITGESVNKLTQLLGVDMTSIKIEMFKNMTVGQDEINTVFEKMEDKTYVTGIFRRGKKLRGDVDTESLENLIENTKDLEKFVNSLEKDKSTLNIKQNTVKVLRDAITSFKNDIAQGRATVVTDEQISDHYSTHRFKAIIYSKLTNNKDHFTISDITGYEVIDSKEALIDQLQTKRREELQSLHKIGNFNSMSDDPILDLVTEIASSEKDKMSNVINLEAIMKGFVEGGKIKDSDIDMDSIFSALSSTHANLTAADVKRYMSSGIFDSKKMTGEYKTSKGITNKSNAQSYVKEFSKEILPNVMAGLERLVDSSFINESMTKNYNKFNQTNQLLNEVKSSLFVKKDLNVYKIKNQNILSEQALNEISFTGAMNKVFQVSGFARLATVGLGMTGATAATPFVGPLVGFLAMAGPALSVLLIASSTVVIAKNVYEIYKNKSYVSNFNPYKDKDFKAAITPIIMNAIRMRVGSSICKVFMQYKADLAKLGIKVVGEDSPYFADHKKAIDSRLQVSKLKKNMDKGSKDLYEAIRSIVKNVKITNQDLAKKKGLGWHLDDALLDDFTDTICLKPGAPLEDVFNKINKNSKETNETFIYEKGLGFLLNEASDQNVSVSTSELYNKFFQECDAMLYQKMDYNGVINDKIIENLEQYMKWWQGGIMKTAVNKMENMWRGNMIPFVTMFKKNKDYEFMIEKLGESVAEVTNLPSGQFLKIINNKQTRDEETRKRELRTVKNESFVHENKLFDLLFENKNSSYNSLSEKYIYASGLSLLLEKSNDEPSDVSELNNEPNMVIIADNNPEIPLEDKFSSIKGSLRSIYIEDYNRAELDQWLSKFQDDNKEVFDKFKFSEAIENDGPFALPSVDGKLVIARAVSDELNELYSKEVNLRNILSNDELSAYGIQLNNTPWYETQSSIKVKAFNLAIERLKLDNKFGEDFKDDSELPKYKQIIKDYYDKNAESLLNDVGRKTLADSGSKEEFYYDSALKVEDYNISGNEIDSFGEAICDENGLDWNEVDLSSEMRNELIKEYAELKSDIARGEELTEKYKEFYAKVFDTYKEENALDSLSEEAKNKFIDKEIEEIKFDDGDGRFEEASGEDNELYDEEEIDKVLDQLEKEHNINLEDDQKTEIVKAIDEKDTEALEKSLENVGIKNLQNDKLQDIIDNTKSENIKAWLEKGVPGNSGPFDDTFEKQQQALQNLMKDVTGIEPQIDDGQAKVLISGEDSEKEEVLKKIIPDNENEFDNIINNTKPENLTKWIEKGVPGDADSSSASVEDNDLGDDASYLQAQDDNLINIQGDNRVPNLDDCLQDLADGSITNSSGKDIIKGVFEGSNGEQHIVYQTSGKSETLTLMTTKSTDGKSLVTEFTRLQGNKGADALKRAIGDAKPVDPNSEEGIAIVNSPKFTNYGSGSGADKAKDAVKFIVREPQVDDPKVLTMDVDKIPAGKEIDIPTDSPNTQTLELGPDDVKSQLSLYAYKDNDIWTPKSSGIDPEEAGLKAVQGFNPKILSNEDLNSLRFVKNFNSQSGGSDDIESGIDDDGNVFISQVYLSSSTAGGGGKVPPPPTPDPDPVPPTPTPDPVPPTPTPDPVPPTPTPDPVPPTPTPEPIIGDYKVIDIKHLGGQFGLAALGTTLLKGFLSSSIESSKLVPLVRGIDWARLIKASLCGSIIHFLVENKGALKERGVDIVGGLPPEVSKIQQATVEDFGMNMKAAKGSKDILDKSELKKLQKDIDKNTSTIAKLWQKSPWGSKSDISEDDVLRYLQKDLRKMMYSYHKAFNTNTYDRIITNKDANLKVGKRKQARANVNRKAAVGLTGLLGGALTATGVGAAIGIPMMVAGAHVYRSRDAEFGDDQLITGDENEAELQRQIDKLTTEDLKDVCQIIVDVAKKAKSIEESRLRNNHLVHLNRLTSLLFEEDFKTVPKDKGDIDADYVQKKLEQKSLFCYDGSFTPGSDEYKNAEGFVVSKICNSIEALTGINISGKDKYKKSANINIEARAAVDSSIPKNQPAIPQVAALTQGCGAPAMNQPMSPMQFMNTMNMSGGPMMQMFYGMMMYNMMQQSGGNMQGFQNFMKQLNGGKMTGDQAAQEMAKQIDKLPDEAKTITTPEGKQEVVTSDAFIEAFRNSATLQKENLPYIKPDKLKRIFTIYKKTVKPALIENNDMNNIFKFNDTVGDSTSQNVFIRYAKDYFNIDSKPKKGSGANALSAIKDMFIHSRRGFIKFNIDALESEFSYTTNRNSTLNRDKNCSKQVVKYLDNMVDYYCYLVFKSALDSKEDNFDKNNKLPELKRSVVGDSIAPGFNDLVSLSDPQLSSLNKMKDDLLSMINLGRLKSIKESRQTMQSKQKDDVYLLGKLSSLLFEEKIEANVPKKKKVKTKNIDEVNLRQEWLKLWDI